MRLRGGALVSRRPRAAGTAEPAVICGSGSLLAWLLPGGLVGYFLHGARGLGSPCLGQGLCCIVGEAAVKRLRGEVSLGGFRPIPRWKQNPKSPGLVRMELGLVRFQRPSQSVSFAAPSTAVRKTWRWELPSPAGLGLRGFRVVGRPRRLSVTR